MTEPEQDERRPWDLVGGPMNGEFAVIGRCEHGDWPDLHIGADAPAHLSRGMYRLDTERRVYKWIPDEPVA